MRTRIGLPLLLGLGLVFLVGCEDKHAGRMEVAGTVKLKGEPLKSGIVTFEPLDGQDTGGNVALDEAGAYAIPRENGLKPGKYLVRVTAGDGETATNPVNPDEPPGPSSGGTNIVSKDLVPADWNVNSKQEITVSKDGPNTFNFDIK